jgi:hypothetical protein
LKIELKIEKIGYTTIGKWKLKYGTKIWNEKIWKFSFLKIEMKTFENFHFWNLKWKFPFEIWNKNWPYHRREIKKIKMKKSYISFKATGMKVPIIPMCHLCIPLYTTCASCGGIQLISAVRSFHTVPFPIVI